MTLNQDEVHLVAIAVTRYALGRTSYIVADTVSFLERHWSELSDSTKAVILRDIDEAFVDDDLDRRDGMDVKRLGHDCDRASWSRIRALGIEVR